MKRFRIIRLGVPALMLLASAYFGLYSWLRDVDPQKYRPYFVKISYGKERVVLRCAVPDDFLRTNPEGFEDLVVAAKDLVVNELYGDDLGQAAGLSSVTTSGLFIIGNRRSGFNWRCIFRPLERLELNKAYSRLRKQGNANRRNDKAAAGH